MGDASPEDIRIESVEKRYGPTAVLRGVSATLAAGKFLFLVGPSGYGKGVVACVR